MICEQCGKDNRAGQTFCVHCGAPMPSGRTGNGFYDIFRGEPTVSAPPRPTAPIAADESPLRNQAPRSGAHTHPPKRARILPLILSGTALLLSGVTLAVVLSIAARLPKTAQDVAPAFDAPAEVADAALPEASAYGETAAQAYLRGLSEGYDRGAAQGFRQAEEAARRLWIESRRLTAKTEDEPATEETGDTENSETDEEASASGAGVENEIANGDAQPQPEPPDLEPDTSNDPNDQETPPNEPPENEADETVKNDENP